MLKSRIIPTLLTDGFGLVKGEAFASWRTVGAIMPAIRVYNRRDVDELIILDVAARREGRSCDPVLIEEAAAEVRVPLAIGGGLSSVHDIATVLAAGADKVVLNTAALDNPALITSAAERFGAQSIVVSIDAQEVNGGLVCVSNSGSRPTPHHPVAWAKLAVHYGAGELMINRAERDGTLTGYDHDLIESVAIAVDVPVIASGGARGADDFVEAVKRGASAVAAGAVFQFTHVTPGEARQALRNAGVPMRRG